MMFTKHPQFMMFFQWYHGILHLEIPSVREAFEIMPFSWRCWRLGLAPHFLAWGPRTPYRFKPFQGSLGILRVGRIAYPIQSPALLQSMIFRRSCLVGYVIVRWKSFNTAFFWGGAGCISHDGSMGLCHMYSIYLLIDHKRSNTYSK